MSQSNKSFLIFTLSALLTISCYGQKLGDVQISSANLGFKLNVPYPSGIYAQFTFFCDRACEV